LDRTSAKRSTTGIEIDVGDQVDSTISNRRGNLYSGAHELGDEIVPTNDFDELRIPPALT
jgi:hypothetical protein